MSKTPKILIIMRSDPSPLLNEDIASNQLTGVYSTGYSSDAGHSVYLGYWSGQFE